MKKSILIVIMSLLCGMLPAQDLLTDIVAGKYKAVTMSEEEQLAKLTGDSLPVALREEIESKISCAVDGTAGRTERYELVYAHKEGIYRRSFKADYYLYDKKRKNVKHLGGEQKVQAPVWSPDGRYIAYYKNDSLYMHKVEFGTDVTVGLGGFADWLYEEEFGCTSMYCFSPDSKQLAFVRLDESVVPKVTLFGGETYRYPKAGEPNAIATVVVYDIYLKSLKTMQLPEQKDSYIPRLKWTNATENNPQGSLAIFRLNRDQNKLEMFLANPKSTVCTRAYLEESKQYCIDYAQVDEWQFLSDGSFICVNETSGFRHAYLYSALGKKLRQLTTGNFDVTKVYGYDEKIQTLFYQAADKDPMTRYIYALDTKKGKVRAFDRTPGMHKAVFAPDWSRFVDEFQSVSTPNIYTMYDVKTGKELDKWNKNILPKDFPFPIKEFFSFVMPQGDTLNGWKLVPKNFDASRKYPVLMFHYSGPASQQVLNRWKISWEEYLAAEEGIICVCVDPRGTDARGRAFRNATYMHIGSHEAEDQVYTARYLATLSYVDADRIGIWGWSYGGYATIMSMTVCGIHPELGRSPFKFGMAVAPVTDWRLYDSAYTERFMRRPQVNEDGYKAASLIGQASKLQGNLLIMHGLDDDNVHVQNTLGYTEALVQAGIQFEMQIYPDDNHFLRKRANYQHVYRRLLKFLKEQIQ